jgi:hypothetical protein
MIAPVVAATSHTLLTRLPGREGCGTRVHTTPDALATSTAATRPTTCSCSSSSISCGSLVTGTVLQSPFGQIDGRPGASVGKPKV